MIRANRNKLSFGIVAAVAMFAALLSVQVHAQDAPENSQSTVQVGTYDVEAAFQQHPAQKKLEKASQTAQAEMQAAQQEGDQQKLQQIQQQFEQSRGQIVESFYQDVSKAMPAAAQAADVKVVASEVSYAADNVETKDITTQLIEALDKPREDPPVDASDEDRAALEVGTWDIQAVFQQHPAQEELNKASQTAQAEMQAAQQENDRQKLQQIQQQFEQSRGRIVETFYQEINSVIPAVAKSAKVNVVAVEVSYTADDVETRDITAQLIEGL